MRINTFIVVLLVTFIICNNNNHIKGKVKDNKKRLGDPPTCAAKLTDPLDAYKEITGITADKSFVNKNFIVYVGITGTAHKYTYYSYSGKLPEGTIVGRYKFTTVPKLDYTLTGEAISAVHNYEFPWSTGGATLADFSFGSVADGTYAADCVAPAPELYIMPSLLAAPDVATVAKYEKMDQYKDTFDEKRNAIDDDDIGEGVMLSRVDAAAPNRNYNIFLSKTKFCHFSCKIDNTECDLLVYETADYKSQNINDAFIIGLTPKAKYYKAVKADTVELVDTCAGDRTKGDECTMPQYTVISKGDGKILTGYYKDEIKKYLVSASPPKMPADIYAKFPTYIYCLGEPGVQGVSNMLINSILLILIVILMI